MTTTIIAATTTTTTTTTTTSITNNNNNNEDGYCPGCIWQMILIDAPKYENDLFNYTNISALTHIKKYSHLCVQFNLQLSRSISINY